MQLATLVKRLIANGWFDFCYFLQTLAKVVGGWKVHEANLVKTIADYASEKEKNVQEMVKLKEVRVLLFINTVHLLTIILLLPLSYQQNVDFWI